MQAIRLVLGRVFTISLEETWILNNLKSFRIDFFLDSVRSSSYMHNVIAVSRQEI